MPDKKGPRGKIPILAPHPQPFVPDQKQGRDGKGEPDGESRILPGYYDDAEDLPADYYHGKWRERDFKPDRDSGVERRSRALAMDRARSPASAMTPGFYVQSDKETYIQRGGYCKAASIVFMYLRRLGLTPSLAISAMTHPVLNNQISIWQAKYTSLFKFEKIGQANFNSTATSQILHEMDRLQGSGRLGRLVKPRAIKSRDIWTENLVGVYPDIGYSLLDRQIIITKPGNTVCICPHIPTSAQAATLQQALFSGYQPPRSTKIPVGTGLFGRTYGKRITHPFCMLEIIWNKGGEPGAHCVLVDFSDWQHPGIFDPNFGWLEPARGYNYLQFEMTLQHLWEHYTDHGKDTARQGLRHMPPAHEFAVMRAYQVYEQTVD